jgi:hypothetical protein
MTVAVSGIRVKWGFDVRTSAEGSASDEAQRAQRAIEAEPAS